MIAVIASFFNPAGFENIVSNYWRFRECLGNCDFYLCEASFDGTFETDATMKIHATDKNFMFQKERMLNLLLENLPDKYTKVIWTDTDLIYCDKNWIERMERMLETYNVVQGFSTIDLLNNDGSIGNRRFSYTHRMGNGLPGGCWGCRLDCLPDKQILDDHPLGGCDTLQMFAWQGRWNIRFPFSKNQRISFLEKGLQHYLNVGGKIGRLEQNCSHLFHGTTKNRQYVKRNQILEQFDFNPYDDIRIGSNGLWEWCSDKPELHKQVKNHFVGRREDD